MIRYYIGVVHKSEGSCFGVSFPDWPGCISGGDTLQEAAVLAHEALALALEGVLEDGEMVPEARGLDAVRADPDWSDGDAYIVVGLDVPERAVRVNISMQEDMLRRVDAAARAAGMSRSAFLVAGARRMLDEGKSAA